MNDNQKLFFALGLIAIISICLVPPWQGKSGSHSSYRYAGHRFVFYTGPSVSVMDVAPYRAFEEKTRYGKKIHWQRLVIEIGAVMSVTTLLILVNRKKKKQR